MEPAVHRAEPVKKPAARWLSLGLILGAGVGVLAAIFLTRALLMRALCAIEIIHRLLMMGDWVRLCA